MVLSMIARPEETRHHVTKPDIAGLQQRFAELLDTCSRFSREIAQEAGWNGHSTNEGESADLKVEIARTIFGKWSLDILTLLYLHHEAGFQEIRRALGPISSRVLSSKLTRMQENGLVRRDVKPTRPPRVAYSLTERGLTITKLGEPVFLYLRLSRAVEASDDPVP